ncbi:MAG: hypothetical protein C5B56_14100 [Proteobacteria bacterium]|nr:MAG: hypothetical protein C5B56_14100 [Pseudomonadota bacterium]
MFSRQFALSLMAMVLLGLGVAGCDTAGMPALSLPGAPAGSVAFERIDGLPEGQFRKLVSNLTHEADTRRITVVSRSSTAQYRVKGYAAAQIRGKQTMIVWVWDVYDRNQQRVTRLGGEETASNRQKGWGAADDLVLQSMAREGITQLAAFLAAPPDRVPPPAAQGSDMASAPQAAPVSMALAQ